MFRATFRRLLALDDLPERTALAFFNWSFHCLLAVPRSSYNPGYLIAFLFRFNKIAIYSGPLSTIPF